MRVLQIGRDDWSTAVTLPKGVDWAFVDADDASGFDPVLIGRVDVTIIDSTCDLDRLESLDVAIAPYKLIVGRDLMPEFGERYEPFFTKKVAVFEHLGERQKVVDDLPRRYFSKPFGQKLEVRKATISPFQKADWWFEGNAFIATTIENVDDFRQLVIWKENILFENQRALELWPEFQHDPGVELQLVVQLIQSGTADVIVFHRSYSEAELAEPIIISNDLSGYLVCSIFAKGSGVVKVGPIHYRHSRLGVGQFIPGGKRMVDSHREELFYYFHPGDLKPPLNIYFSGYRPAEGFEGFFMMAGLGHPFLLLTDPRLEGGRFYLASEELEGQVRQVIRELIDSLGFSEKDVIFSGLSMGSFGALYYGSQFDALAIIAGKPIIDLGYVAERGRLVRPRDFLTVFDMVNFWNKTDENGNPTTVDAFTRELVERWRGEPGFGDTKILMSYMMQDDYDDQAYYTLLNSQTGKPTSVIARGYQGRHNDDSKSIVTWFVNQYKRVIDEYQESR